MDNALGQSQSIVLLGGRSDIGLAIVRELISPNTKTVVLAGRKMGDSQSPGQDPLASKTGDDDVIVSGPFSTILLSFDASDNKSHHDFVSDLVADVGDLDVVIVAFGVLGEQSEFDAQPHLAAELAEINFGGVMSVGLAIAEQFRRQGHGHLVMLSSVAGERVRKSNFVYGATKAAMDAFAQGLADSLADTPARVTIVRPGFVHSAMTAGRQPAPFSTTPDEVARATVKGMRAGRRIVWAPGILRWVFMILRHLPTAVWRRLPLG